MASFKLEFKTGNAALQNDFGDCTDGIVNVLERLAANISSREVLQEHTRGGTLTDSNGNTIGRGSMKHEGHPR